MTMRKLFEEVALLADKCKFSKGQHRDKLIEELGELFNAYNKQSGSKKRDPEDTDENIRENILEEGGGDVLQIIFALMHLEGFTYDDIKGALAKKNKKWKKVYVPTREFQDLGPM